MKGRQGRLAGWGDVLETATLQAAEKFVTHLTGGSLYKKTLGARKALPPAKTRIFLQACCAGLLEPEAGWLRLRSRRLVRLRLGLGLGRHWRLLRRHLRLHFPAWSHVGHMRHFADLAALGIA